MTDTRQFYGSAHVAFDHEDSLRSREFIISWLTPTPHATAVTLRVRRHRRLTQHSLPGGLLDFAWTGLAPADRASFAGAFLHSITASGSDVIHCAGQSGMRKGQLTCFQFRYGEAISGWNRYLNISSPRVRRVALRSSGGKPMI
jgi:hypothetical protein